MKLLNLILAILMCSCLIFASCSNEIDGTDTNISSQQSEIEKTPSSFILASAEMDLPFGKMKSEYSYDEQCNLIEIESYSKNVLTNSEKYKYDDKGYLIEKVSVSYDNSGNETFKSTEAYVNSADGLVQSGTIEMSDNTSTFINQYDNKNRITLHEQKDSSGNTISKQEYTYTDDFNSFECVELDGRTHIIKYDANGNELENAWLDSNGNTISSSVNEYDSHNNVTKTTNHKNSVTEQKHTYNNEVLVKTEIIADGELTSTIEYNYDEYGNLVVKKQTSVSGTVETTVNTWTPVYED